MEKFWKNSQEKLNDSNNPEELLAILESLKEEKKDELEKLIKALEKERRSSKKPQELQHATGEALNRWERSG
jgi:ABC-type nitrate/sulfonate/bicarbonate transport system substrate-binding protein